MGYYTNYTMQVSDKGDEIEDYITERRDRDDDFFYALSCYDVDGYWQSEEPAKWYDHQKEVAELSKKFPYVLFTLHGEGEESGDIWIKYFKNGKVQICTAIIVFDEFDESKLK